MSATPSAIHQTQPAASALDKVRAKKGEYPPTPFGPSTWNTLYYACIVATILVGLGTILNGGAWIDAILRMFITLMGGSILAIAFLTFVIIPLHIRHYENLVAAQKEAQAAAKEKAEQETKAQTEDGESAVGAYKSEPSFASMAANPQSEPSPARIHEDQAASLRRMTANAQ